MKCVVEEELHSGSQKNLYEKEMLNVDISRQNTSSLLQHDNIMLLKKKVAFTLAEVLVTLSILGVVAAISIPNLIQNYQKQATVSRLKMAYSILDNMTQLSYIENGYPPIDKVVEKEQFETYFGKYLNIAKRCGTPDGKWLPQRQIGSGCFKNGSTGTSVGDQDLDTFYNLDGSNNIKGGYNSASYYMVLLKNGMGLGVSNNYATDNGYSIIIDIDGPNSGSSKLGHDVFQFTYTSPIVNSTRCNYTGILPGAWRPSLMDSSCVIPEKFIKDRCAKDNTGDNSVSAFQNGSGCSGLIIKDGWKISSDYPWNYAHKK